MTRRPGFNTSNWWPSNTHNKLNGPGKPDVHSDYFRPLSSRLSAPLPCITTKSKPPIIEIFFMK